MSSKLKIALHTVVSIGGNILLIGIIPMEYKAYAVLAFNLAQVIYAYYDPTYQVQLMAGKTKDQ